MENLNGSISNRQQLQGFVTIGTHIKVDEHVYILVDEDGVEMAAVLVDEPIELTATADDIREGMTAITNDGMTTGNASFK